MLASVPADDNAEKLRKPNGLTCLVYRVCRGLVFSYHEREELFHIPVERRSQICVNIDVEEQPIRAFRFSERPEFAHP